MNKKIGRNIFSYSMANIFSKVILFAFNTIAARYYGSDAFGIYNYAVSVVSYFIMFANMGIQGYAVYELSKQLDNSEELFCEVVSSEIFLGVLSSLALICYTVIFPVNATMVLIVGSTILISALDIAWFFQARQETHYVALQIASYSLVSIVLLSIVVVMNYKETNALPIIVSFSQLISYIFTWFTIFKRIKIKFKFTLKNLMGNIKKGLPFLFSGIFAAINCNIDIIFLTMITDNHVVGVYSAIYKIINLIIMIVGYIVSPAFPEMIHLYTENNLEELNNLTKKLWQPLCLIIFPVVVGGVILNEKLIILLFGNDYYGGGVAIKLLLLYCLIFYFRELYGYTLTMIGKQSIYMKIVFASCVINITCNLILIPKFGINGAAFATLISEVANFTLMKFISSKFLKLNFRLQINKILIATLIMGCGTLLLNYLNVNVFLILGLSILIYSVAIYCLYRKEIFRILGK